MTDGTGDLILTVPLPNGFSAYNAKSKQFVSWREGCCGPAPLVAGESVPASVFHCCHTVYWNNLGYYEMNRIESSDFVLYCRRNPHSILPRTKRTFTKRELRLIREAQLHEPESGVVTAPNLNEIECSTLNVDCLNHLAGENIDLQNLEEDPVDANVNVCNVDQYLPSAPTEDHSFVPDDYTRDEDADPLCSSDALETAAFPAFPAFMPPLPFTPPPPTTPFPSPFPWTPFEVMMYALYGTLVWSCTYLGWYCTFFPHFMSPAPVFNPHMMPFQPRFRRGELVHIMEGTYSGCWGRIKGAVSAGNSSGRARRAGYRVRVKGTTVYIPASALMPLHHTPIESAHEEVDTFAEWMDIENATGTRREEENGVSMLEFWIDRQPDPTPDL